MIRFNDHPYPYDPHLSVFASGFCLCFCPCFASVLNIRNRFSDKELSRPFLRKTIHQINKDLQTYRDQDPLGNGDHHGKID